VEQRSSWHEDSHRQLIPLDDAPWYASQYAELGSQAEAQC
jgi:hypothetical protein